MAPVQSLQQVSLYAEPVQSLSDVADQLSHAALLTQRFHHRVQLLEEVCVEEGVRTELVRVSGPAAAPRAQMKTHKYSCWVFSDGGKGNKTQMSHLVISEHDTFHQS